MPPYIWYDDPAPDKSASRQTIKPQSLKQFTELSASAGAVENTHKLLLSTSESKHNVQFSN